MERFRPNQKKYVRESYKRDVLFRVLYAPCKEWERKMGVLRLSAEEVFLECLAVLDEVKECEDRDEVREALSGVWDSLYCDMRDMRSDAPEAELRQGASEIVAAAATLLAYVQDGIYTFAVSMLIREMAQAQEAFDPYSRTYLAQIAKIGDAEVRQAMNEYAESEEHLSDTIKKKLKKLPSEEVMCTENQEDGERLTNRQMAILISQLLNVTLTPEYTNINALAKLISMISGKSEESIRQTLMSLSKKDFEDNNVQKDIDKIVDLLNNIHSKLGDEFRSNVL